MPELSIITPCYESAEELPALFSRILPLKQEIDLEWIAVDDGSRNNTFEVLKQLRTGNEGWVKVVRLAHNAGSFNAFRAGMDFVSAPALAHLVVDLQDPPELIPQMYAAHKTGERLVIATRQERKDPALTRVTAGIFHWLMRSFGKVNVPNGGYDLVLMDAKLVEAVKRDYQNREHIFYRICSYGINPKEIPYVRQERSAGRSKWTLRKKFRLFLDSLILYTKVPMMAVGSLILAAGGVFLFTVNREHGWAQYLAFAFVLLGIWGWLWLSGYTHRLNRDRHKKGYEVAEVLS